MVMALTMMLVIKVGLEPETSHGAEEGDPESCMSCLVAVGKIQPSFQVIMMRMIMIHSPYEYGVHFESCSALNNIFFLRNACCLKTFATDNNRRLLGTRGHNCSRSRVHKPVGAQLLIILLDIFQTLYYSCYSSSFVFLSLTLCFVQAFNRWEVLLCGPKSHTPTRLSSSRVEWNESLRAHPVR